MTTISRPIASTMSHVDPGAASLAARGVDLMKTYGKGDAAVRALDAVSVGFEHGRCIAVMGPARSNKSTLIGGAGSADVGPHRSGSPIVPSTSLSLFARLKEE